MTALQHYELHCDATDCLESFHVVDRRAGDLRRRARQEAGWVYAILAPKPPHNIARIVDYCRAHAHLIRAAQPEARSTADSKADM